MEDTVVHRIFGKGVASVAVVRGGSITIRSWSDGRTMEVPVYDAIPEGGEPIRGMLHSSAMFVASCLTGRLAR